MNNFFVILAAGKGTRMNASIPKVLHPLGGKPIIEHVLDTARSLKPKKIHLILNKETNCEKLHYIYCYKKDLIILRVNNIYNYCPEFMSNYGYPINVEMMYDEYEDIDNVIEKAI